MKQLKITKKERMVFEKIRTLEKAIEYGGNIEFDDKGKISKLTLKKGTEDGIVYDKGISNIYWHTHTNIKNRESYSTPTHTDYRSSIRTTINNNKTRIDLVFDKEGTWVFKPTPKMVSYYMKMLSDTKKFSKFNKDFYEIIYTLNIGFGQYLKNKGIIVKKISLSQYCKYIKDMFGPGIGFEVNHIPIKDDVIIRI